MWGNYIILKNGHAPTAELRGNTEEDAREGKQTGRKQEKTLRWKQEKL